MLTGKTKSGFKFEIDETVADDMELLEDMAKADRDTSLFPGIIEKVLGADQKARLYDHVRNENGKVPIRATLDEFIEMMNIAGEKTKNS